MYKSSLCSFLFQQQRSFPVFIEQLLSSLYYFSCLPCYPFAALHPLRAPDCLRFESIVEMISRSFIIQASIALTILASSLTSSVNAAAIEISVTGSPTATPIGPLTPTVVRSPLIDPFGPGPIVRPTRTPRPLGPIIPHEGKFLPLSCIVRVYEKDIVKFCSSLFLFARV